MCVVIMSKPSWDYKCESQTDTAAENIQQVLFKQDAGVRSEL